MSGRIETLTLGFIPLVDAAPLIVVEHVSASVAGMVAANFASTFRSI